MKQDLTLNHITASHLLSHWRRLLLVFVLAFAQFSALIHSEVHPFHKHSELCDIYTGVEHQSSDLTPDFALAERPIQGHFWSSEPVFAYVGEVVPVYSSRAPPVFS
ncbi:MAG: hypothetical protein HUJ13_04445 [Hydrogenovibrio crunogenus]|uniref:Uncharacterized protein n=1 Tax=Hydrogenovibrio crunogenus (strain DSM 25203 / XCL-2) TaxID=317025 RepID=Q31E17_HYDCU|nr:hypothetical protein [Hydrogenovibrio crunogenus]